MDTETEIKACLHALGRAAQSRRRQVVGLGREKDRLTAAGMSLARPSWRVAKTPGQADKLSMIFPQEGARRKRVYVGTDPGRQRAALADMARGERFRVISAEQAALATELRMLLAALQVVLVALRDHSSEQGGAS